MVDALLISNLVLWMVIIILGLLVFALARQVGILHERVAPAGALQPTTGPKAGELTSAINVTTLEGDSLVIGGPVKDGLAKFILFISPTCPVCKALVPTAKSLIKSESGRMQLLFASDGSTKSELEQHKNYARDLALNPYLLSEELGITYQVSRLPFAVLIGSDGTLKSKGLVNTREHMESLIEAMDSGIATVQEYVEQINAGIESSTTEQSS